MARQVRPGRAGRIGSGEMKLRQHSTNNDVLRPPSGATSEECVPLPITRARFPDGEVGFFSFWYPTPEELQRLNEGKGVRLLVLGVTTAPMAVEIDGDGAV